MLFRSVTKIRVCGILKVTDRLLERTREVEVDVHAVASLTGYPGEKTRGPLEHPALGRMEKHPSEQPAVCELAPELSHAVRQRGPSKSDAIGERAIEVLRRRIRDSIGGLHHSAFPVACSMIEAMSTFPATASSSS